MHDPIKVSLSLFLSLKKGGGVCARIRAHVPMR